MMFGLSHYRVELGHAPRFAPARHARAPTPPGRHIPREYQRAQPLPNAASAIMRRPLRFPGGVSNRRTAAARAAFLCGRSQSVNIVYPPV